MTEVRKHIIRTLPLEGRLFGAIRCKKCGNKKNIFDPITEKILSELKEKSVCSACRAKSFSIDIFQLETSNSEQLKFSTDKKCTECGAVIEERTLLAVPHTQCCSLHLTSNPGIKNKILEPLGSREDFKKDSSSNWSRSRHNKL